MARNNTHSLARKAVTAALVALLAFDGMPAPAFAEAIASSDSEFVTTVDGGQQVIDIDLPDEQSADGLGEDVSAADVPGADDALADEQVIVSAEETPTDEGALGDEPLIVEVEQDDVQSMVGEGQADGTSAEDEAVIEVVEQGGDSAQNKISTRNSTLTTKNSTRKKLTSSCVAKVGNKAYTGKAIKPKPAVKVAGLKLKLNRDYTLSYKNNKKVGTATIIVKGKGKYKGTVRRKFKIVRASIGKATVSGYKSSYTYTGKAIKPQVTVKRGSITLKKGTHYTVSYGANTQVGTGSITIKGKGAYKGTKKITFQIKAKVVTYYKLKRDTWNFENLNLSTPLEFCKKFYGASQGSTLYYNAELYQSSGQCYGMAATVGAVRKYGYPSAKSFHSGSTYASNLYQVKEGWVSTSNGLSARDYVRYGQLTQFESGLNAECSRNYENYSGLVSAIRTAVAGGTPIVIDLFGDEGGHTVFPIGIKSSTSASTAISIYDSNFPGEAQTLTLYKTDGAYNKYFSYSGDCGWGLSYLSWETPCDDLQSFFTRQHDVANGWIGNNSRYTLYALSSAMKATINGKEYDLSKNSGYDNKLIVPVHNLNGKMHSDSHLYWIRDDAGEVTFSGIDEEATITVAAQTGGVEATVESGSEVAVDVRNFDDNGVTVSGDEGDEFSVRFFDDDGTGTLEEVTVSGTVDEDQIVEATQDGDAIEVTGADDVIEE